jgi:hypothetical protein
MRSRKSASKSLAEEDGEGRVAECDIVVDNIGQSGRNKVPYTSAAACCWAAEAVAGEWLVGTVPGGGALGDERGSYVGLPRTLR